ncbi:hypothetical protein [Pareuzebyella sediminis]|uniref:hypothetical protein n=1 Tax=Pareuzebyella sediminis TaxID=2607998 RepID=UPI0011EE3688|nr:hypothetical protein [Pareuzebyella sediminis]
MRFPKNKYPIEVYKYFFSIILFLLLANSLLAQSKQKDSLNPYDYWAQRGIIQAVYAYMEDYKTIESKKSKDLSREEIEGMNSYKENYIKQIKEDSLPDIEALSGFLKKNNWGKTENNIFQPLYQKFKASDSLNFSFFEVEAIKNISEYINYNNVQREIIEQYKTLLAEPSESETEASQEMVVQEESLNERYQENQESIQPPDRNSTGPLFYILVFIAGLLIGGWIVFFISKQKIYSILQDEKFKYLNDLKDEGESFFFKYLGMVYILKKSKDSHKKSEKALIENNKVLTSQIRDLKSQKVKIQDSEFRLSQKAKDQETIKQEIDEAPISIELEPRAPEKQKTRLFFSMPDGDGRFNNHNAKSVNDGKNFYRIDFMESADHGDLFFLSSEKDKRAIHRLESFLKPVCDIENLSDAESSSRIDLISPGKVNLENDNWVIDPEKKVTIKLV